MWIVGPEVIIHDHADLDILVWEFRERSGHVGNVRAAIAPARTHWCMA
jgi:hypothetical protein